MISKRKTPPISNYFKPIYSSSNYRDGNIKLSKDIKITDQLTINNNSNPNLVNVQTSKLNIESFLAILEQTNGKVSI